MTTAGAKTGLRGTTPLTIIGMFLGLTEVSLVVGLTNTTGTVQGALTVFVFVLPLFVLAVFSVILWYRPWVFYPPSEYHDVRPREYVEAIGAPLVRRQMELAKAIESNPTDPESRFELIESLIDSDESQVAILMHEQNVKIPRELRYAYEDDVWSSSGKTSCFGHTLKESGLCTVEAGGLLSLTDEGHAYAEWLLKKGRKAAAFWSPVGSWGEPRPGGIMEMDVKTYKDESAKREGEFTS